MSRIKIPKVFQDEMELLNMTLKQYMALPQHLRLKVPNETKSRLLVEEERRTNPNTAPTAKEIEAEKKEIMQFEG